MTPPTSSASRHSLALGFAGRVAEAVHERHVGGVQELGRGFDRLIERGFLAVDQRVGVEPLGGVVLEPRLAEDAGALRLDDALVVGVQFDVVAHAPAEGAGGVLGNGQFHGFSLRAACGFTIEVRCCRPNWAAERGSFTPGRGHGRCRERVGA